MKQSYQRRTTRRAHITHHHRIMVVSFGIFMSVVGVIHSAQAVVQTPTHSCSVPVAIDGEPHEWGPVDTLVEDDNEIDGTSWYYNAGWSTVPSDDDSYSMVPDEMFDLQAIKLCNTATDVMVDFETYYPPFKIFRIGEDQFYELGDPAGAGDAIGLPQAIDHWLVLKLTDSDLAMTDAAIYYYAIHLTGEVGDTETLNMITSHVLYQESDQVNDSAANFSAAEFDPASDTLLTTLNAFMDQDLYDNESAYEASFDLLYPDGETDALSVADFTFGDTLSAQALSYQTTNTETGEETDAVELLDQTDVFLYEIGAVSVGGVKIPKATRQNNKAAVEWQAISEASMYRLVLKRKSKIIRQVKTTRNRRVFKRLSANTRYKVSITAKVGDAYTPWSNLKQFKTRP